MFKFLLVYEPETRSESHLYFSTSRLYFFLTDKILRAFPFLVYLDTNKNLFYTNKNLFDFLQVSTLGIY